MSPFLFSDISRMAAIASLFLPVDGKMEETPDGGPFFPHEKAWGVESTPFLGLGGRGVNLNFYH